MIAKKVRSQSATRKRPVVRAGTDGEADRELAERARAIEAKRARAVRARERIASSLKIFAMLVEEESAPWTIPVEDLELLEELLVIAGDLWSGEADDWRIARIRQAFKPPADKYAGILEAYVLFEKLLSAGALQREFPGEAIVGALEAYDARFGLWADRPAELAKIIANGRRMVRTRADRKGARSTFVTLIEGCGAFDLEAESAKDNIDRAFERSGLWKAASSRKRRPLLAAHLGEELTLMLTTRRRQGEGD